MMANSDAGSGTPAGRHPCAEVCTCSNYGECQRLYSAQKLQHRTAAAAEALGGKGRQLSGIPVGRPPCGCQHIPCNCGGGVHALSPQTSGYRHHSGALAAGNDVLCAEMTVEQAKVYCQSLRAAVGFTFSSTEAHPDGPVLCYFKSSSHANSDPLWQRYMKISVTSPVPPKTQRSQNSEPTAPRKKQRTQKPDPASHNKPAADILRGARTKRRAFSSGSGVPELKEENTLLWFKYIAERQRVYNCWFNGAGHPWTKDTTLAHGRMCNNFRFLDRESTWAIANIVEPLRHRPADLIFNILIFRCYLNWHKSMELLGLQTAEGFDRATFEAKLRKVHAKLGKLSSAAYNVGSFHAFSKADALVQDEETGVKPTRASVMFAQLAPLMPEVARSILDKRDSLHTFKTLIDLKGVGRFLGWQCCLDLGYWNPAVYNESFHVEVGPGAEEGLSWLFKDTGGLDPIACVKHLASVQTAWFDKAGISPETRRALFGSMPRPPTTAGVGPSTAEFAQDLAAMTGPLNLMAIEGALCEGNKYFRVHYNDGSGRFKQQYRASTGADARYRADFSVMMRTLSSTWGAVVGHSPTPHGTVAIGFRIGIQASALPCLAGGRSTQPVVPAAARTAAVEKDNTLATVPAVKKKKTLVTLPAVKKTKKKKKKKKKVEAAMGTKRIGAGAEGPGRRYDATGKLVNDPSLLVGKTVEIFHGRVSCIGRVLEVQHVFGVVVRVELSNGTVVNKRLNKVKQVDTPLRDRIAVVKSDVTSMDVALQSLCADLDRADSVDFDDDDKWNDCEDDHRPYNQPLNTVHCTHVRQTSSGRAVTIPKWLQDDGVFITGDLQDVVQAVEQQGFVDEPQDSIFTNTSLHQYRHSQEQQQQQQQQQQPKTFSEDAQAGTESRRKRESRESGANCVNPEQEQQQYAAFQDTELIKRQKKWLTQCHIGKSIDEQTTRRLDDCTELKKLQQFHFTKPIDEQASRRLDDHAELMQKQNEWLKRFHANKPIDPTTNTAVRIQGTPPGLPVPAPSEFECALHSDGFSLADDNSSAGGEAYREAALGLKRKRKLSAKAAACVAIATKSSTGAKSAGNKQYPIRTVTAAQTGAHLPSKQSKGSKKEQPTKRQVKMKRDRLGQKRSCSAEVSSISPPELPEGYVLLRENQFVVEAVLSKRKSQDLSGQFEYLVAWKGYGNEDNTWEPRKNLEGNICLVEFEQKEKEQQQQQQWRQQLEHQLMQQHQQEKEEGHRQLMPTNQAALVSRRPPSPFSPVAPKEIAASTSDGIA